MTSQPGQNCFQCQSKSQLCLARSLKASSHGLFTACLAQSVQAGKEQRGRVQRADILPDHLKAGFRKAAHAVQKNPLKYTMYPRIYIFLEKAMKQTNEAPFPLSLMHHLHDSLSLHQLLDSNSFPRGSDWPASFLLGSRSPSIWAWSAMPSCLDSTTSLPCWFRPFSQ